MSSVTFTGRSAELGEVRAVMGPGVEDACRALVVLGETGIGKSTILADLRGNAEPRGWRVLSADGRERESGLPFAGLRQLLRPILPALLALSGQEAEELRAAIGMGTPAGHRDLSLASLGILELLAGYAGLAGGVLLLVDDAQWMDAPSLEVLAFAAQHLDARPVAMVLAARGDTPPAAVQGRIRQLPLGPLGAADASELLDTQPHQARGQVRVQLLAQAAGNPLALVELSRAIADERTEPSYAPGLPLPLTDRLSGMFAAPLRSLPVRTRNALLLIAAADEADLASVTRAWPAFDLALLAPAEEVGLVKVTTNGVRFRQPLARSAVYYAATFAARAAAHRELATILRGQPDRRAWHLGAACFRPDESIASLLAATAAEAGRRAGPTAAALALQRAADLAPEPGTQATWLVAAAEAAVHAGHADWAHDLAARALALPGEEALRSRAMLATGRALAWTGRNAEAAATLLPLASETAGRDAGTAWNALATAATAAYQAGHPEDVQLVADALTALPSPADDETRAARLWVLAVTGRAGTTEIPPPRPAQATADLAAAWMHTGAAAWLAGETADAIRLLRGAREAMAASDRQDTVDGPLAVLGWAYLDAGQWDEALELAAQDRDTGRTSIADSTRYLITATVEAARGQADKARRLITAALSVDAEHSRLITARARHVLGLCALSDGDYDAAFDQLRGLFTDDGTPHHYHVSYLATADLALAAARSGQRLEGRKLLKQIKVACARTQSQPSPRMQLLIERADGVLADPATPDAYPAAALSEPEDDQWPFELAKFRLEAGEWLRRHRRVNEAKNVLRVSLDAFRALRAAPWERRAEAELRACGVAVPGTLAGSTRLRELTPQQRRILSLAAQGLTNREIAQRLFLSPRTVSSHLYHAFPVLGVAGRHQLQLLFAPSQLQTEDRESA